MPGRDVPWVPTPQVLIDKMLDMARLTRQDVVVDLGSGDGRTVIAAARRGSRARGVEFNSDLVELSKRLAAEAGVANAAIFIEGDMFQADFSDATVLPLFLLTENLDQLVSKFLTLRPGTRIVNNGFEFTDWDYDEIGQVEGRRAESGASPISTSCRRASPASGAAARRTAARAGISVAHRYPDLCRQTDSDRAGPPPGRCDSLQCRQGSLYRSRGRRYDRRPDRERIFGSLASDALEPFRL
jgi:SAM-dependent methyltransferase